MDGRKATLMTDLSKNPDNLVPFFDLVASNQKANMARFPAEFELMRRVNICLSTAGQNLINPKPVMAGVMFLRCQYAYKAAVGMALSGQVVKSFAMMRSCLEYAAYALTMYHDPGAEAVFMGRHVSSNQMKSQKEKFKISNVREVVAGFDTKLAELFKIFYERTIDFGGHANPHGTMSTTEMVGDNSFITVAMTVDDVMLRHAMKSSAQVGLTALFIFQHIFKAKFELLGIRAEMNALRATNL